MQKPSFITVSTAAHADIKRRLGFYPGQRAKILVKIPNIFSRFLHDFGVLVKQEAVKYEVFRSDRIREICHSFKLA